MAVKYDHRALVNLVDKAIKAAKKYTNILHKNDYSHDFSE